jgi:uncharacterized protein
VINKEQKQTVISPCISVCALDENDVCTGCYRLADEIRCWGSYSNSQKREVLQLALDREKRVNPFL